MVMSEKIKIKEGEKRDQFCALQGCWLLPASLGIQWTQETFQRPPICSIPAHLSMRRCPTTEERGER